MPKPQADYDTLAAKLDQLQKDGALADAIEHWKQLKTKIPPPDWVAGQLKSVAEFLNKRGIQLYKANRIGTALDYFMLSLRAREEDASALNNAATCLKELGRLEDSTQLYRQAVERHPHFAAAHGNILMNMQYTPGVTPAALAEAHRQWDERHARPLRKKSIPHDFNSERPLRIGLVSPDLGQHPVGIFLVRYLEHMDRMQFIVSSYADGQRRDVIADRIRTAVSHWHDVHGLSDEELARKIEEDKIDILVDLGGHTADNRLGVFARKPAPVQISWLGYPGDTGLSAIDDVIGDPHILPLSLQPYSVARIRHLLDSFVCFDPPADAPPVSDTPAKQAGQIIFGCFNNPAKVGAEVIELWAEILKRLPEARLLFKYKGFGEDLCRQDIERQFAAHGIDPSRLEFQGASSLPELFAVMQGVDIALDPFPFAGGLMTCLTLWMGVPVISWPGETFASRQALSFLTTIGITDTLANSREDYVEKAAVLAKDLPRLNGLRHRLRPALESSPLCNGPRAAAGLQNLLREIWHEHCVKV